MKNTPLIEQLLNETTPQEMAEIDRQMSNNKQSMKLYTEEQMHSAMLLALGRHGIYVPNKHYQDLIDLLTPIELPSDEEIDERIGFEYPATYQNAFKEGAKWVRDKIGGDNEQQ